MEKIEHKHYARNLIIVTVIAEFFSSFTLWLIESPIKYPLFVIETLIIVATYAVLNNYELKISYNFNILKRFSGAIFLDLLLVCFASALVIINQFHLGDSSIGLVLAFICTTGLSGFALLSIGGITKYFSKLEILVLSFITSFILSGSLTLSLIWMNESSRSLTISSLFIIFGIISLLKHFKTSKANSNNVSSLSNKIDVILIFLCLSFYAIFFYYVYPKFTLITDTDVARLYSSSIILSRTPDLFSGFISILFTAFGSTLNVLSWHPDRVPFLSIQILSNFILPLTVYVFAKRFLSDIDRRIPIISTVFYSFTSNLSFIYFAYLKLHGTQDTEFNLLGWTVAQKAYEGSLYSFSNLVNFTPTTVEIIMFSFAFILLRVLDMPRLKFIILYTLLIFAMYLEHVAGAIILVFLVGLFSMVSKSKSLRLDDVLVSSFIAFVLSTLSLLYYRIFWTSPLVVSEITLSTMLPVIAPLPLIAFAMFWRRTILNKIHLKLGFATKPRFYFVISVFLVAIFLFGILAWFFIDDFKTILVHDVGVVPWFIYPMGLGIAGLLSLITIRHLHSINPNSSMIFLFTSIGILFIIGRAISFVNLNLFNTGYWEIRILYFMFLFVSLLAPLSLIKIMDLKIIKRKFLPNISASLIIASIFFLGFSSLVLQLEYWSKATDVYIIPKEESDAKNYLKDTLQQDSHAFTISPLLRNFVLDSVITPYQYGTPEIFVNSKNPEIPMFALSTHNLPHSYIYMNKNDLIKLQNNETWFVNQYLPTIPVIFSNQKIIIYNGTHISYPRSNSDVVMLIPSDSKTSSEKSFFYAYELISKDDRNYTVMFDKDHRALTSKIVIIPYDPAEQSNGLDYFSYVKSGGHLIVLNTNGYGSISDILFNNPRLSFEANKIVTLSGDAMSLNTTTLQLSNSSGLISHAFYSSEKKLSVMIADKSISNGTITYVNIFPIILSFEENKTSPIAFQKSLDIISHQIISNKMNSHSKPDISKFVFKSMIANGNVMINTTSLIFTNEQFSNMTIKTNGKDILVKNISKLKIGEYDTAVLHTNYISLANGSGLYTNQNTGNSLTTFFNKNTTVDIMSGNNGTQEFHNVSEIFIQNNEPIHFHAWKPRINVTGDISFKDMYGGVILPTQYSDQGTSRDVLHQDAKISGRVYLSIFMSDFYTISDNISVKGTPKTQEKTQSYDEVQSTLASFSKFKFSSLPIFVNAVLAIPFVISAVLFLVGNNKNMNKVVDK